MTKAELRRLASRNRSIETNQQAYARTAQKLIRVIKHLINVADWDEAGEGGKENLEGFLPIAEMIYERFSERESFRKRRADFLDSILELIGADGEWKEIEGLHDEVPGIKKVLAPIEPLDL